MSVRVGIRDLRNRTSEMVALARSEGEVIITSHGEPIAVLHAYSAGLWQDELRGLLHEGEPVDSGFAAEMAADDEASMDDLT